MTTSKLYNCLNCGRQYNPKVLKKCPVCQTPHLQSEPPAASESSATNSVGSTSRDVPHREAWTVSSPSTSKSEYGRVARASAKIVNNYGLGIQILGWISGVIIFFFVAFSYGDSYSSRTGYVLMGIVAGAATVIANMILGALYRMLANYVLYKTTD